MVRLRQLAAASAVVSSSACAAIYGVGDLPSEVGGADGGLDAHADQHAVDAPRPNDATGAHDAGHDASRDAGHDSFTLPDAHDALSDTTSAHDAPDAAHHGDAGDAALEDGGKADVEASTGITISTIAPSPTAIRLGGTLVVTVTLSAAAPSDLTLDVSALPSGVTVSTGGTIAQGDTSGMVTLTATSGATVGVASSMVAAGTATSPLSLVVEGASGTLDTTFNQSGVQNITPNGGGTGSTPKSIAVQADGAILLAGNASAGWALVRLNADGSADTTFNDNVLDATMGAVLPGGGALGGVAIEPNTGRIVLAGIDTDGGFTQLGVLLYNTDGSRYEAFGTSGLYTRGPSVDFHVTTATSVATNSAGDVAVVGNTSTAPYVITFSGSANNSINLGGGLPAAVSLEAVTYAPSGSLIVGGHTPSGGGQFYLAQLNAGLVSSTFDDGGLYGPPSGSSNQYLTAAGVATDNLGNIFLVGTDDQNDPIGAYTCLSSAGALQTTPSGADHPGPVNMNQNGYLGVACGPNGGVAVVVGSGSDMAGNWPYLARIKTTGGLDTTFASAGVLSMNQTLSPSFSAVAIDPQGRIVVAGNQNNGFYVARYWP
jgi:uncharacterized delta-60 repeat protein